MPWNLSLLTVLFNVCYFITKGRNEVVYTTITRALSRDYFTNDCKNCYEYGAVEDESVCKCEESINTSSGSLFLRSEKHCKFENEFVEKESCQTWRHEKMQLIDIEGTDSYVFPKAMYKYRSCQLDSYVSYINGSTGKWQLFNLSGNIILQSGSDVSSLKIKVTPQSPSLGQFKGHVMKLKVKCEFKFGSIEESCLLFKAKGTIKFPLNCSLPPPPSTTSRTTIIPTRISSCSVTVTPTITTTPPTPSQPNDKDDVIIAAIIATGTVLCLSLISAFAMVLYRYTHMCKSRGNQARNPDNGFDVIMNPGPQTYRIQEEPLYVEVPDIYPCDKGSVGASERPSVILNPYMNRAVFSRGRQTTDPLPSRPERDGNFRTAMDAAGPAYQNERNSDIDDETDGSIVLKNPKIKEASFSSIPRSENDLTRLPEVHELDLHHHHHHGGDGINEDTTPLESEETDKDLVYQGLMQKSRTQSVFVCPTCNEDPVYQRLRVPRSCPHAAKNKPKEKTTSLYESLKPGLEKGSRESVYASTAHVEKEPLGEEEENRNSGEGMPDYQILEPEETVANEEPDESTNHDYNVLEGPGENCDEVDEYAKDKTPDMDPKTENVDLPVEPSEFLNMEDSPVYAKPLKTKKESDLPNELPEVLNVEDTPNCAKPWKTKEDPDLPIEPSEVLNVEDNPAYAKPSKMKQDTDSSMEPSQCLNIENNPAYVMPLKAEAIQPNIRRKSV